MVRLSFAVRPPAEVLAAVADLPRPAVPDLTWSVPEHWIVKLRPLGHVPLDLHEPLLDAVEAEFDGAPPVPVRLGRPVRRWSGRGLCAPVTGLDELSAGVFAATTPLVPVTHPQPYVADLVLANGRVPPHLTEPDPDAEWAEWTVTEILLIADRSAPRRPRLEDVGAIELTGP